MVAQRRVDWDFLVAPNAGFAVPDLPVVGIVAVVDDVAREANKGRVDVGNGLHQCDAHWRIRRLCIFGIMEARVSVSREAKWSLYVEPQINGRRLRARLL